MYCASRDVRTKSVNQTNIFLEKTKKSAIFAKLAESRQTCIFSILDWHNSIKVICDAYRDIRTKPVTQDHFQYKGETNNTKKSLIYNRTFWTDGFSFLDGSKKIDVT